MTFRTLLLGTLAVVSMPLSAQTELGGPFHQSGPRVGVTFLAPGVVERVNRATRDGGEGDRIDPSFPFISQVGWQFEFRTFQAEQGLTGVLEVVPLLSGLDRGLLIPTLTVVTGARTRSGVEFGIGPNLSVTPQEQRQSGDPYATRSPVGADVRLGLALVAGVNGRLEGVSVPVNAAVVFGEGGARLSLLLGLNTSSRRY